MRSCNPIVLNADTPNSVSTIKSSRLVTSAKPARFEYSFIAMQP
jgi:hypothetical protein